jgi:hypothetical protein
MKSLPKPIRKLARQWCEVAYERELATELEKLYDEFGRWKAGTINAFDLSELIHKTHDGAVRELYKFYVLGAGDDWAVACAVKKGILKRDELPPELLESLEDQLKPGKFETTD